MPAARQPDLDAIAALVKAHLPTAKDEVARIAALHEYGLLDTPPELEFENLTKMASLITGMPIALLSLLDERRQWFKSRIGMELSETPRGISFCQHALHDQQLLEIHDATCDNRVSENPLVTGDMHIRFYAGAPIVNPEGHMMGTLCVLDRIPGQLTATQRELLTGLASEISTRFELRRRTRQLADAHFRLQQAYQELNLMREKLAETGVE